MLNKLFIISLFILIFGQITSISKQAGQNIYIFDILVLLFSFIGTIYFLGVKKSFKITFWHFSGFAFISWGLISLMFSLNNFGIEPFITGIFYIIRFVGYLLSSVVLFNMIRVKKIDPKFIVDLLILSGIVLSLLGFVQLIILPDFTVLDSSFGWDPHKNRLASTFFDPNFTGAYLVMIFAILLDKIYGKDKFSLSNIISFLVVTISIFLTFSRSSWGMLSVVILIFGLFRYKKLLILFLLIAFSAYFAIPRVQTRISGITDPADSAAYRLVSWSNTLEIVQDNWLIGTGYNTYRFTQSEYGFLNSQSLFSNAAAGSDSSMLFVLATTGIIGLFLYLIFFFYPLFYAFINRKDSVVLILALTLGLFMESQFINSLFYPQIMFLWFSIIVSYLFYTQR
jgi:O-antigen ligase